MLTKIIKYAGRQKEVDDAGNVVSDEPFNDEVKFDFAENIAEAIDLYGESTCIELLNAQLRIRVQSVARANYPDSEKFLSTWDPSVSAKPTASRKALEKALREMSPEERTAILAKVTSDAEAAE